MKQHKPKTALCLHCKRKINLDKYGRFRRHIKTKKTTIWCDGIFETPEQQRAAIQNATR